MTTAERAKDKRLKSTYNSSLAEQNKLLADQAGCCAICSRPFAPLHDKDGKSFTAFQDHWHKCCPRRLKQFCGKCNRGLLCFLCNKYLVGVVEKQNLPVDKLLEYLQKWTKILKERGARERIEEAKPKRKKAKKIRRA